MKLERVVSFESRLAFPLILVPKCNKRIFVFLRERITTLEDPGVDGRII